MQQLTLKYKSTQTVGLGGSRNARRSANIALGAALLAAVALVAGTLAGCDSPYNGAPPESGSLRISIGSGNGLQPLSLLPDTSMVPAEYRLRGSGPAQTSFETATTGGLLDVHDLQIGEWRIEVSAVNGDDLEIGYGAATVMVEAAVRNEIALSVRPLSGTGLLSLTVGWPADQLQAPAISAALTDRDGTSRSLQFESVAAGQAEYHDPAVDAGYYTLVLQLSEGDSVVAGAVETVRIVRDAHTEGSFRFDDLNHPTGTVDIIVAQQMDQPLEVELSGAADLLPYGGSMSVSASVANAGDAQLQFSWYLNGAPLAQTASVQLGADLSAGTYRLDVVAFAADGLRSGSATHGFRVE